MTTTAAARAMIRARFDGIAPECTSSRRNAHGVRVELLLPSAVDAVQDQLVPARREERARHEHGERVLLAAAKQGAAPDAVRWIRRVHQLEAIRLERPVVEQRR